MPRIFSNRCRLILIAMNVDRIFIPRNLNLPYHANSLPVKIIFNELIALKSIHHASLNE